MSLENRIAKLEAQLDREKRRNRWLPGITVLACLLAFGLFETTATRLTAQGKGYEDEIRAKKFVVVDNNGKPRAVLSDLNDGTGLTLSDKSGKPRVVLSVFNDGTGLTLFDKNGKGRAGLSIFNDEPGLTMADKSGKGRARLGLHRDEPEIVFFDNNGKTTWSQ